jgi:hypothetical protein
VKGKGCYTAWLTLHTDNIHAYGKCEYGGEISSDNYKFKEDDFDSFMSAYHQAVAWAKNFLEV